VVTITRTGCLAALALACCLPGQSAAGDGGVVIGMPRSLFQGMPEFMIKAGSGPFLKLMRDNTGVEGSLVIVPDAMTLAEHLNAGKIHIAVFQGHEFAWARKKHEKLVPICVADPMQPVQAYCLVSWDCKAKHVGDLKDEKIVLPSVHRDFCELFLSKQKEQHMGGKAFAGQLTCAQAADAIQDVIDGKGALTVVDAPTLSFFRKIYPGQYQNLKVLSQSDAFPNACIAVKKDELPEATVAKFRRALLNAPNLPGGGPMLTTWKLKGFVRVPDDYDAQLKSVEKNYPTPPAVRAAIDK
jgi:ABC-type phosphate/phosphonate transport system substrate-binding protein